ARLGAHRNTVVRAYAELEAAGFLVSTVGRGTYVTAPKSHPESPTPGAPARRGLPWASLLSHAARSEPLRRYTRMRRAPAPRDVIDLTRMHPPPELLPVELFRRCVEHVLRTNGPRALVYAPHEGF